MLKITNTGSGEKEPLLLQSKVSLYACGITAYDHCHLGHARSAIVFDMIRNYLEYKGHTVQFVKNFTDIDDKILHRALQERSDFKEIAERYITAYEEDMERLLVRSPTLAPRATEHIPEMIVVIEALLEKGMAYAVAGNVYFDVTRFPAYGRLSRQNTAQLMEGGGGRVESDPGKKNPLDFALWKGAKPSEPSWDAPWGKGRPGWHIECSAMALKHLGQTMDFHGGGQDLIFPHHENERAQSEAYTGEPFARCWIHHGHVTVNHEKMSKSLGNFFTVREIFSAAGFSAKIVAEVIRYFLLSTHYRSPIDFSDLELKTAKAALDRFYSLFQKLDEIASGSKGDLGDEGERLVQVRSSFNEAMDDDLNTPRVMGLLHEWRSEINRGLDRLSKDNPKRTREALQVGALFREIGRIFGLFQVPPAEWSYQPWSALASQQGMTDESIACLVQEREQARQTGDWSRSDAIRVQLQAFGILLEDRPDGTTRIKR